MNKRQRTVILIVIGLVLILLAVYSEDDTWWRLPLVICLVYFAGNLLTVRTNNKPEGDE